MGNRIERKYFTISQWEKEEEYLREMHKKGFKLVRASGFGKYEFEPCEPEDVVYRLDYNREARKEKAEYCQLFADCGWEHVLDYVGYSYFRKKASSRSAADDEIFGDVQSKLDMCKRVVIGRLLPLLIMFCVILPPQIIANYMRMREGILWGTIYFFLFLSFMVLYVWVFVTFAREYYRVKKQTME